MKISLFLLALMFSTQAFSRLNYYHEYCQLDSAQGPFSFYKDQYWNGHHLTLVSDAPGIDDYQEVWLPGDEGSDNDAISGDEAIAFADVVDTNVKNVPYDDGCWQGYNIYFDRSAKVDNIKPVVSDVLRYKQNDIIKMKCNYEHLVVSGDRCDDL